MLTVSLPISAFLAQDFVYKRGSTMMHDLDVDWFSKLEMSSVLVGFSLFQQLHFQEPWGPFALCQRGAS